MAFYPLIFLRLAADGGVLLVPEHEADQVRHHGLLRLDEQNGKKSPMLGRAAQSWTRGPRNITQGIGRQAQGPTAARAGTQIAGGRGVQGFARCRCATPPAAPGRPALACVACVAADTRPRDVAAPIRARSSGRAVSWAGPAAALADAHVAQPSGATNAAPGYPDWATDGALPRCCRSWPQRWRCLWPARTARPPSRPPSTSRSPSPLVGPACLPGPPRRPAARALTPLRWLADQSLRPFNEEMYLSEYDPVRARLCPACAACPCTLCPLTWGPQNVVAVGETPTQVHLSPAGDNAVFVMWATGGPPLGVPGMGGPPALHLSNASVRCREVHCGQRRAAGAHADAQHGRGKRCGRAAVGQPATQQCSSLAVQYGYEADQLVATVNGTSESYAQIYPAK